MNLPPLNIHSHQPQPLQPKHIITKDEINADISSKISAPIHNNKLNAKYIQELETWANTTDPLTLSQLEQNVWLFAKVGLGRGILNWQKELNLADDEPLHIRRIFSLSGYTKDNKISIWGKANGLDNSMSKEQSDELKNFIDSTKVLNQSSMFENKGAVYKVDEFISKFDVRLGSIGGGYGISLVSNEVAQLLDNDMDIDKFKDEWLRYTAEKILGENADVKISFKDGSLTFEQTSAGERIIYFNQTPTKRVTYTDEQSQREFLKFLKDAFARGENIGDVLNNIAIKSAQDYVTSQEQAEFKAIQATSKSKGYEIKDIKKEFFENFIKAEQSLGTDIATLIKMLNKIGKIDLRA